MTFISNDKFRVGNAGNTVVKFANSLGVANLNGPSRSMFPYFGVSHDQDPFSNNLIFTNIRPGEVQHISGFRLDIVDNAFAAMPGWPNSQMASGTNLLFPAVCPTIRVHGGSWLIGGVFCHGYAV